MKNTVEKRLLNCSPFELLAGRLSEITHFPDTSFENFAIMPTIVEVSDEELQRLLGDGGLKPAH